MKPSPFELLRPTDVGEVLSLLARHGSDCRLLAGGQSLVPMMNLRIAAPAILVDLNRVASLRGVRVDGDVIRIGAMTRQQELLGNALVRQHLPLLARTVPHIGHVQTRSRGTLGGSLSHADPSAELPVAMVALDATFTLRSESGERQVPARAFFRDALTTVLEPTELLAEIAVRIAPPAARSAFREIAKRHGDFAVASAAVQFTRDAPGGPTLVAAIGGMTSVPHHCAKLCAELARLRFDVATIDALVAQELAGLDAMDDPIVPGHYRRRVAAVVLGDCLKEVLS